MILDCRKDNINNNINFAFISLPLSLREHYNYSIFYQKPDNTNIYLGSNKDEENKDNEYNKNKSIHCKGYWTINEIELFLINARNKLIELKHDSLICLINCDYVINSNNSGLYDFQGEIMEFSDIFDEFSGNYNGYLYYITKLFTING